MITDRLTDRIRGRTVFRVREVFPNEWLDACAKRGIALRLIRRAPGMLEFEVFSYAEKEICALALAYGAQTEILSEKGLPVLFRRYRHRVGVPIGLIVFFVIHLILAGTVWSVDLEGFSRLDPEPFSEYLSEIGVRPGMFTASVDCEELRLYAEGYSDEIETATVNLIGSRLFVRILEREMPPELPDTARYSNIIAAKDGEVLSADFFAGVGEVRAGDAVVKGQLLASGVVELSSGKAEYMNASARVMARTKTVLHSFTASEVHINRVARQRTFVLPYLFLGVRDAQQRNETELRLVARRLLNMRGGILPIGFSVVRDVAFEPVVIKLSEPAAMLICFSDFAAASLHGLGSAQIESCTENVFSANGVGIEGIFVCEEDIAKEEAFYLLRES